MNATHRISCLFVGAIVAIVVVSRTAALAEEEHRPNIVIADFEGQSYGDWKTAGEAFGSGPASGTLSGQMEVTGFQGKKLINSYLQGDESTGKLASPEFKIERPWLNFLIGGGGYTGETCVNLLVDGKVVRTGTGPNTELGTDSAKMNLTTTQIAGGIRPSTSRPFFRWPANFGCAICYGAFHS